MEDVGLDASIIDASANPCQDFYQFACGKWLSSTRLPDDKDVVTRSFTSMKAHVQGRLRAMLERFAANNVAAPAAKDPLGVTRAKLGDFYASCMDEATLDKAGADAIRPLLKSIAAMRTAADLATVLPALDAVGVYALVRVDAEVDSRGTGKVIGRVARTGWELSSDDYGGATPAAARLRAAYVDMLRASLAELGDKPAAIDKKIEHALAIEAVLAADPPSDPTAESKLWSIADLEREAPRFEWRAYFRTLGLSTDVPLRVSGAVAIRRVSEVASGESIEILRDYLVVRTLAALNYSLSKPFRAARFAFRKARWGAKNPPPRSDECIEVAQYTLDMPLLAAYVDEHHLDRDAPSVRGLVQEVYDAWDARLRELPWLDDGTRRAALEKLHAMPYHIGYPDLKPYEWQRIDRRTFAENVMRADRATRRAKLATIGQAPDRNEWTRSPFEANAYHDHERNSIFIHLAMIEPPIYDPRASAAVQFGAMGMVIGHELGHGFDHHGAKYDATGNEHDWWSPTTRRAFEDGQRCFENQFSSYLIFPDLHVDGKKSVGENIADVAGLRMALRAFHAHREHQADPNLRVVAGGFDEDQQFFLSRAQSWCTVINETASRSSQRSNPHIEPRWAVNGPLHDLEEFHEAFHCAVPKDMCSLW